MAEKDPKYKYIFYMGDGHKKEANANSLAYAMYQLGWPESKPIGAEDENNPQPDEIIWVESEAL